MELLQEGWREEHSRYIGAEDKGDADVSIGIYASVLFVMGMEHRLGELAQEGGGPRGAGGEAPQCCGAPRTWVGGRVSGGEPLVRFAKPERRSTSSGQRIAERITAVAPSVLATIEMPAEPAPLTPGETSVVLCAIRTYRGTSPQMAGFGTLILRALPAD